MRVRQVRSAELAQPRLSLDSASTQLSSWANAGAARRTCIKYGLEGPLVSQLGHRVRADRQAVAHAVENVIKPLEFDLPALGLDVHLGVCNRCNRCYRRYHHGLLYYTAARLFMLHVGKVARAAVYIIVGVL